MATRTTAGRHPRRKPVLSAADRLTASLAEHAPSLAARLVPLGEGWDHRVFRAGDVVVRVQKDLDDGAGTLIEREAAVLRAVAPLTDLRVPEPIFVDAARGVMAYRFVEGEPLCDQPLAVARRHARALRTFVEALSRIPNERLQLPQQEEPLAAIHAEAAATLPAVAPALNAAQVRSIEAFLAEPLPAEPSRWCVCHHDLGAEHVLVSPGGASLTGVIDWTDAAFADPVYDLALLVRDLGIDVLDVLVPDAAEQHRAVFYARCAALEDLAYGIERNEPRYVKGALASLGWLG